MSEKKPDIRDDIVAFMAFLSAEQGPPKMSPEQVRGEYCRQCQLAWATTEEERRRACQVAGCGLSDPDGWAAEVRWVYAVLTSTLFAEGRASESDVFDFNQHVLAARCATIGLGIDATGRVARGYTAGNLRGLLHGVLQISAAHLAGDLAVNYREHKAEDLRRFIGQARKAAEQREILSLKREAARLRDSPENITDEAIAAIIMRDSALIRRWFGRREDWPRNRARIWAEIGGEEAGP